MSWEEERTESVQKHTCMWGSMEGSEQTKVGYAGPKENMAAAVGNQAG